MTSLYLSLSNRFPSAQYAITITRRDDSVADAIKIKAAHDKYFGHDSKINGNVVTCDRHDLTGKISQSDL